MDCAGRAPSDEGAFRSVWQSESLKLFESGFAADALPPHFEKIGRDKRRDLFRQSSFHRPMNVWPRCIALLAASMTLQLFAAAGPEIPLWPDKAPGESAELPHEK